MADGARSIFHLGNDELAERVNVAAQDGERYITLQANLANISTLSQTIA